MTPAELAARPTLARHVRLRADPADGEPVLLYPEGFLALNETAHDIVSRCDGSRTTEEILTALAAEYEVATGELQEDVAACLRELRERNFLSFAP